MKIILADDQPEVCSALRLLLEQRIGQAPLSEVRDVGSLLGQVQALHPDLILLDWELPGLPSHAALVASLRRLNAEIKIVALSGRPEARTQALASSVDAFMSKGDPPEELIAILEELGLRQAFITDSNHE